MSTRTAIFVFVLICLRYYVFGTITIKEIGASVHNGAAVVNWITSAEWNNEKFIVERSADCEHFVALGALAGEINSTSDKSYSFTDAEPMQGISYYRVVSIDNSNQATASQILIVDNRKSPLYNKVFPCPFKEELNIVLNVDELPADSKVVIYGNVGREVYSCKAGAEVKLDLSHLNKGAYYITVESNNKRLMEKKVIKSED